MSNGSAAAVIATAAKFAESAQMRSSAELCLSDARSLLAAGNETFAKARALKSLAYSVGVFSSVYRECAV